MIFKPVESFPIEPKYTKPNGQYLLDIDRADLPLGFEPVERSLVTIPPGQVGGNHKHSRSEGFIGIGNGLTFYWQDEEGITHSELMNPDSQLRLIVVRSFIVHAIRNKSAQQAVLLEYADQSQTDSIHERVEFIEPAKTGTD